MRCADLTPTPGKRRSAWIKTSRALVEDIGVAIKGCGDRDAGGVVQGFDKLSQNGGG